MELDQSQSTSFDWKKHLDRTWVVIAAGYILPPLGVVLSWRKPDWSPRAKWIATGVMGFLTVFRIIRWTAVSGIVLSLVSIAFAWLIKEWAPRAKCIATGLVLVALVARAGFWADSAEIRMVKTGTLEACSSSTVEQMVNGFMGSPSWSSGVTEDGDRFVNVSGDISVHEKKVRALLQFFVNSKSGAFKFKALEYNGVPQPPIAAAALMSKMCKSVKD